MNQAFPVPSAAGDDDVVPAASDGHAGSRPRGPGYLRRAGTRVARREGSDDKPENTISAAHRPA